jgi:hypothetical protein
MPKIRFGSFSYGHLVLIFAAAKLLVHGFTAENYELHRDALLYLAQGEHPDAGYWSVPPLTALLGRLFRFLFGDSTLAVRLLPATAGAVSMLIIGDAVRRLGGKIPAGILAMSAFLLSGAYLRTNSLYQPVALDQMFWLLVLYLYLRLLLSRDPRWWIVLSLALGAGLLTKYSIAILGLGILLATLAGPQRWLLFRREVVFALILGLIIVSPNIWWQYRHNWVVFHHLELLQRHHLVHVSLGGFILGIVLMNINTLVLWITGLAAGLFREDMRPVRPLAITVVIVLLLMAALQAKSYYTLGLYTILFAFGAVAFESWLWPRRKAWFAALWLLMPLILYPLLPLTLPVLKFDRLAAYCDKLKEAGLDAPMRWEDGRVYDIPQDFADMCGWRELASIVERTWQELSPAQQARTAIYAENYGQAGAIAFYGKKAGLPWPVCFHESFLFWSPDSLNGVEHLIYINDDTTDVATLFREVVLAGRVSDPWFRERNLPVWLCSGAVDSTHTFYRDKVAPLKQQFIRHYRP